MCLVISFVHTLRSFITCYANFPTNVSNDFLMKCSLLSKMLFVFRSLFVLQGWKFDVGFLPIVFMEIFHNLLLFLADRRFFVLNSVNNFYLPFVMWINLKCILRTSQDFEESTHKCQIRLENFYFGVLLKHLLGCVEPLF